MMARLNKLDTIGVNFGTKGRQLLENVSVADARPLPSVPIPINKTERVASAPSTGPMRFNDLQAPAEIPSRGPEFTFRADVFKNHWSLPRIGKEAVWGKQKSIAYALDAHWRPIRAPEVQWVNEPAREGARRGR